MLWLTDATSCRSPMTALRNVYLNNESGRITDAHTVWPSSATGVSCAGVLRGRRMSWPKLPVTGVLRFGRPPGGSFVPVGVAGDGYVSPGYVDRGAAPSPR